MFVVAILLNTILHLVGVRLKYVLGLFEVKNLPVFDHELILQVSELHFQVGRYRMRYSFERNVDRPLPLFCLNFVLLFLWCSCCRLFFWSLLVLSRCSCRLSLSAAVLPCDLASVAIPERGAPASLASRLCNLLARALAFVLAHILCTERSM